MMAHRGMAARLATRWLLSSIVGLVAGFLSSGTAAGGESLEESEERAMKAAVARVAPSVVRIETVGGLEKVGQLLVSTGPTTGLAVSEDGFILSSAFNFVQKPSSILVTLPSGKRTAAEIVARDQNRMLVLLKVTTDEALAVPEVAPRDESRVGQWTLAVGRTFDADKPSVSVGILSATNRIWGKALQTDAKISPTNYGGPLIDIEGRVMGVLVPMSPQANDELAGAEWYDSGIGFAIPLADVLPQLEKMKRGQDLHPGLLGVALKSADDSAPPVIVSVLPKSPAAKAGLRVDDRISEIEGETIKRQAQLKHALGRRYAGETIQITVMRSVGGMPAERIEAALELAEKVDPYQHPFLGILPRRDSASADGVVIRAVFPDSPAAKAGIRAGDRLLAIAARPVTTVASALETMAAFEPTAKVVVRVEHEGAASDLELELARLPGLFEGELPPAREPAPPPTDRPAVGAVDIKIPEVANDCLAYVPENYDPRVPYGLIVWLPEPNGFDRDQFVQRWKTHCETRDMILLAPRPADAARWQPTEVEFIRKTLDQIRGTYRIDPTRVVVHGYQAGGAMAYLTALQHRDVVRAVVPVDAAIPTLVRLPSNDPVQRLAIYNVSSPKSRLADKITAGLERLRELKYPVITRDAAGNLSDEGLAELGRWIDTLDRI